MLALGPVACDPEHDKGNQVVRQDDSRSEDLEALRRALAASERRAATLAELTALMSEGRDALALAQRAVELTARATKAAGAYVYLWDRDEELLTLRVATEGWQRRHVGSIRLRIGEGVTGWSALMRQPVLVSKDPFNDPRFKPFPELRESSFKSMVAVPIVAPGEEVLGVFSLYAPAEDAFRESDVSLATEVGSLLASGLVQAETLTKLQVQSTAARFLHDLPQDAWVSLERCLQAMAEICAADLDADLCALEVTTDRTVAHGLMHVAAMTDQFAQAHPDVASAGEQRKGALHQHVTPLNLARLRIPLGVSSPIGAVTVYRSRRFTAEDEVLLEAIGAQIAAGALSVIGAESLRPARDRLLAAPDADGTERLLLELGWKRRATTPVTIRLTPMAPGSAPPGESVRAQLTEALSEPGRRVELLGDAGHYLILVETPDATARAGLAERLADFLQRPGYRAAAGVGPSAPTLKDMHRAIRQATLASQWAQLAGATEPVIVRFEQVAHLRLLPGVALQMSSSLRSLLGMLGAVVNYDLDNGTDLAQTLEAYFANSGSVARASEALFIHRNTLRQRIQRIEELIGQSPELFDDWISAGLAARLVRLSRAELAQPASSGRAAQRCPHGVTSIGKGCCGSVTACVVAAPTHRLNP